MKIENKVIALFKGVISADSEPIYIKNSIVDVIDFDTFEFDNEMVIEDFIIKNLLIHSCWFKKGLKFKGNHVHNYVDYQIGGHNAYPMTIAGCIFNDFFNFFDCQFNSALEVIDNVFIKGSNLLGNQREGFKNFFKTAPVLKGNVGNLSLDGIGKNAGSVID